MLNRRKSKYNLSATEMEIMEFLWSTNKKYYYPSKQSETKVEHIKHWTQNFVEKIFDGSLYNFLSSYTGGANLDEKSYNELKKFLDENANR